MHIIIGCALNSVISASLKGPLCIETQQKVLPITDKLSICAMLRIIKSSFIDSEITIGAFKVRMKLSHTKLHDFYH